MALTRFVTVTAEFLFRVLSYYHGIRTAPSSLMFSPLIILFSIIACTSCANSAGSPRRLGNGTICAILCCSEGSGLALVNMGVKNKPGVAKNIHQFKVITQVCIIIKKIIYCLIKMWRGKLMARKKTTAKNQNKTDTWPRGWTIIFLDGGMENIEKNCLQGLKRQNKMLANIICQGSYTYDLSKFHDFPWLFPWPFEIFHDLS